MPAAAAIICSVSPNVSDSIAPTVDRSRRKLAGRLPRKELCWCTPAATAGCASWSRMARPHPAITIISRLIFQVMLSGPARG
jgi:hypothetical protein